MKKLIALIAIATLSLGCTMVIGVTNEDELKGAMVTVGNTKGGGMEGSAISLPGAALIGGVFKGLGEITASLLGNAPIVITHEAPASVPK